MFFLYFSISFLVLISLVLIFIFRHRLSFNKSSLVYFGISSVILLFIVAISNFLPSLNTKIKEFSCNNSNYEIKKISNGIYTLLENGNQKTDINLSISQNSSGVIIKYNIINLDSKLSQFLNCLKKDSTIIQVKGVKSESEDNKNFTYCYYANPYNLTEFKSCDLI